MSADAERARADVHTALHGYLDEGEIAVGWVLTIEVASPDGPHYLAHRAGGGYDGSNHPMAWTAAGMLQASADVARRQLAAMTEDTEEDE